MRIIAGTLKGRLLATPRWSGVRPTSDKLRETLFNVLAPRVAGATLLDGFAGTGAIGIEALSRGAAHVTFVDRDPRAVALVAENLQRCDITDRHAIVRASLPSPALTRLEGRRFDLIVLDPPYDEHDPAPLVRLVSGLLEESGILVLEHRKRRAPPADVEGARLTRRLVSGDSALAFYRRAVSDGDPD